MPSRPGLAAAPSAFHLAEPGMAIAVIKAAWVMALEVGNQVDSC